MFWGFFLAFIFFGFLAFPGIIYFPPSRDFNALWIVYCHWETRIVFLHAYYTSQKTKTLIQLIL